MGLAVFEVGDDDDYAGKPRPRRSAQVPRPAATILFAENNSAADHIMAHFGLRRRTRQISPLGPPPKPRQLRVGRWPPARLPLAKTFNPAIDLWNPSWPNRTRTGLTTIPTTPHDEHETKTDCNPDPRQRHHPPRWQRTKRRSSSMPQIDSTITGMHCDACRRVDGELKETPGWPQRK